jgi:hypothetical protein
LLLAFQNFVKQNLSGSIKKKNTLLHEIEAEAEQTPRGVQFGKTKKHYWVFDNTIRTTAFVLFALSVFLVVSNNSPNIGFALSSRRACACFACR